MPSHTYWGSDLTYEPSLLPYPPVNIDLPGLYGSKNSVPVAAQLALSCRHDSYRQHTHIFTDGSTRDDGSTSSFVIPEKRESHCFCLFHPSSLTTAQPHAIISAAIYTARHANATTHSRRWHICTGSKSALEFIESMNQGSSPVIFAYKILQSALSANKLGHSMSFQWVPVHSGIS